MEQYRRFCRWEDNTELDLKVICVDVMNSLELYEDRDQWVVLVFVKLNLQIQSYRVS